MCAYERLGAPRHNSTSGGKDYNPSFDELLAADSNGFKRLTAKLTRVGGNRSKERDRKSELVLRSTYQIFEWDRSNSDRNFLT